MLSRGIGRSGDNALNRAVNFSASSATSAPAVDGLRRNHQCRGGCPRPHSAPRDIRSGRLSNPTNVRNNPPFFEQPFRYVTAMIVTLTPTSELIGVEIGFLGEAQS